MLAKIWMFSRYSNYKFKSAWENECIPSLIALALNVLPTMELFKGRFFFPQSACHLGVQRNRKRAIYQYFS
jgi:hypothetical protein